MTKDKWKDILSNILDKFEVLEHEKEFFEEEGGVDVEYVIFLSPFGKIRLELIEKPIILDKKTNYSNRIGSDTAINYVYSQTEKSIHVEAYRWSDENNDWLKIDSEKFS